MRALIFGRVNPAWCEGTHEEKRGTLFPAFVQLHQRWKELGAELLGTIDDSILMVGPPIERGANFYELYEVPDLETVNKMLDIVRHSDKEEVNIYRFIRFEAIVGPPVSEEAEAFWHD